MRTSRVSRETQQLVNALSSSRRAATRTSSLQQYSAPGAATDFSADTELDQMTREDDQDRAASSGSPSATLGKRKRASANRSADSETAFSVESTAVRRSPRKAPKLEHDSDNKTNGTPKRKARRQPAKHIKGPNGALKVEPPPNWERVYAVTAAQRKRVLAPVDTMGCESLAETHRDPRDQRLQTLVSLMLSSQTKDLVTAASIRNLQASLPGGLCLQSLLDVDPVELNRLIEKVGFHNNKTKFIKSVAVILRDKFDGDIPDTIEGLVSLPGVGPKMAYLCMSAAWGRDEGIGVDVHVHRITNLWGWHKTSTPEQTRAELEAWLPKDKWHDINHLLVGFGQTVCLPVGKRCGECDLSKEKLCPSVVAGSPVKRRVKKAVEVKAEDGEAKEVVKVERVVVEADDVAVKVEADLEGGGQIEDVHVFGGAAESEEVEARGS